VIRSFVTSGSYGASHWENHEVFRSNDPQSNLSQELKSRGRGMPRPYNRKAIFG